MVFSPFMFPEELGCGTRTYLQDFGVGGGRFHGLKKIEKIFKIIFKLSTV